MVRRALKSRKLRRVFYRTPGSRVKKRYERRKKIKISCAVCGKKTSRAGRPFSGELCHKCSEKAIKLRTQLEEKEITVDEIYIKLRKYVGEKLS